jgi:hypothetical protein
MSLSKQMRRDCFRGAGDSGRHESARCSHVVTQPDTSQNKHMGLESDSGVQPASPSGKMRDARGVHTSSAEQLRASDRIQQSARLRGRRYQGVSVPTRLPIAADACELHLLLHAARAELLASVGAPDAAQCRAATSLRTSARTRQEQQRRGDCAIRSRYGCVGRETSSDPEPHSQLIICCTPSGHVKRAGPTMMGVRSAQPRAHAHMWIPVTEGRAHARWSPI